MMFLHVGEDKLTSPMSKAATHPLIPTRSALRTFEDVEAFEVKVARALPQVDDIDELHDMLDASAGLERLLRSKKLSAPALGAQRRIEARIGQLLGDARHGGDRRHHQVPRVELEISKPDRHRFRRLARALTTDLSAAEWRQSRKRLLRLLNERCPEPRRTPEKVEQADGKLRLTREQRIDQVRAMSERGFRVSQIAQKLALHPEYVRKLAKSGGFKLPDDVMGKVRKINAKRVIDSTAHGLSGIASALVVIDGADLSSITRADALVWTTEINKSLAVFRRLLRQLQEIQA